MLVLTHSTAVIWAVFIVTGAVSGEDVKKAVGGTVSFSPDKLESPVTSITWKHVSLSTVKAIEWDVDDGVIIPNQRFKDITTLDEKTGKITITNLKVEHSGEYTIDINSKEQGQRFSLEVMEEVPKPNITVEKSSNPDALYLICEYDEKIIWKNSAGQILTGSKHTTKGESITVKNTRNPENYYTCTLKNAVSEKTSDPVYERELFVTESSAGLIVGIVILVILLIIIGLICAYLLLESIYNRVNECCPGIESVLRHVDCCAEKRKQYDLAPKGDEKKVDVVSTGDETKVDAVSTGDEKKVDVVSTGDEKKVDVVSTGDEKKVDVVSTGDETKVDVVSTGDEKKVDVVSTGDETKVDVVSTGDEKKVDVVSTDQNNVEDNHVSDATQSQNQ
ncbi:uncharacterized protein LOC131547355 isoform X8 [Onychostoma macrolepis]|uniref:uncharacterized protein LOC131547355 isoform X8 n=1 Tax=Onychostoma macrolepis TaxID=369639 RepID=UPI00272B4DB0|nr:uncharacterized protein LOC131547355 isoform X8 [Onychostoma macrolepis]